MTATEVTLPEPVCVARIDQAVVRQSPLLADGATRRQLIESGFVIGTIQGAPGRVSIRLKCYRPRTWLGRLGAAFGDQDRLAKPVLRGTLSGDHERTQVLYRVDAFGTAVSEVVLLSLGILLVLTGVIVSAVHPMPMPSIGSVFFIPGLVLLVFFAVIWFAVDSAIMDEQYLTDWIVSTLN
jgi:hypothetical protein